MRQQRQARGAPLFLSLLSTLLLVLRAPQTASAAASSPPGTTTTAPRVEVILIGATSSLARKYLFQSFFRAYLEEELKPPGDPSKARLHLYGGATRAPEEGARLLGEYLAGSTSCAGLLNATATARERDACAAAVQAYRGQDFEYVQLRGEAQYAELGRRLRGREERDGGQQLAGRCVFRPLLFFVVPYLGSSMPRWSHSI